MVFNATFNNIPAISWLLVVLVEETGVPRGNHRPTSVTDKFYRIMLYRIHLAVSWIRAHNMTCSCKSSTYDNDHDSPH
jgi:hypothetical protein